MIVCIRVKSDRKVMLMYDLTIKSWRTMKSGCLCVSECGVLKLSTGDDTPHRCHSETTCNTHSQTYWKTHSHTLKPTHLSGGFEIELGLGTNTPNNYPSLLRLVIHFAWIYSHLPLFFPSSSVPHSTFSPPSFLLPHRWWYLSLGPSDKMWQYSNHASDLWQQMPVT